MTAGFQLGVIGSLTLSVASSVAIVICNKALISTLGFPFATTLTSWHLMVTFCTLHVAQRLRFFEPKAIDGQTVVLFGLLNGTSIGLLNLSLGFNSIGFYQASPLLFLLLFLLIEYEGSNSVCSADDEVGHNTLHGAVGDYIPEEKIQRKLKVSSTQLLYQSAPYQAAILFATGPFVDHLLTGRSVFAHRYTFPVVGFIVLSCLIAVSVNFSTFLVIGTTSPVTYQVLGHLKTCLVLSFGYTLLHDPFTVRNILGILVAIFGMALYSIFSVREGKKKSAGDALPVSQMPDKETEPLLATKDNSDTKKANGVAHDC
ncbi:Nucleotide/sugar transporter family protein [Zea mays]|uniref:Nucleotide/sugar transporter family protein n=1 Tax=Zea mays TaxID=4577 RepID=A0A1D6HDM4_MAIZE|nr:Nucleotide/sugar transporter family protein [Zea mays]